MSVFCLLGHQYFVLMSVYCLLRRQYFVSTSVFCFLIRHNFVLMSVFCILGRQYFVLMSVFCLLRLQAVGELAQKMMRLGKVSSGSGGENQSNAKCRSIDLKNCSSKNYEASILNSFFLLKDAKAHNPSRLQGEKLQKKQMCIQRTSNIFILTN